jgi:hypothetical protein
MSAPRPTAGTRTARRRAIGRGGGPGLLLPALFPTMRIHELCGSALTAQQCRAHRRESSKVEIFSAQAWNHLPLQHWTACSGADSGASAAWHASWIRQARDAPGGLPSLSPRHGLPMARRHRGTHRCLTAPVVSSPSTRVPAWPHGTLADKDGAAGSRKHMDGADDAAGSRTGKDEAAGRRIKDEAAGRRMIKDEAAGCRTGSAIEAEPGAGSPSTQLQGLGRTRTRREAVRSRSRWRGSGQGCMAGPVVRATGPVDFTTDIGDCGEFWFMHRPRAETSRPVGKPGVRRNGGLRGAQGGMRR